MAASFPSSRPVLLPRASPFASGPSPAPSPKDCLLCSTVRLAASPPPKRFPEPATAASGGPASVPAGQGRRRDAAPSRAPMWQLMFQFVASPILVFFGVSTCLINTAKRNHLLLTLTTKDIPIRSKATQPTEDEGSSNQSNLVGFHSSSRSDTTGGKQHSSSSCGELQRVNLSQIKHRSSKGSKRCSTINSRRTIELWRPASAADQLQDSGLWWPESGRQVQQINSMTLELWRPARAADQFQKDSRAVTAGEGNYGRQGWTSSSRLERRKMEGDDGATD
ncbi:hypothetical protein ZWY2020_041047 [Hordeum vulgare]|nr:hypothetical protein ZWY2020_041047 [Hordeum vulgare]